MKLVSRPINNRYQREEILGQGRLSTVCRARDLQTGRTVALKILQPHLRAQASIVQRFKREMAAVQRLDHNAIIRIFDIVETPEHLALVMEFAPGVDLKTWVQTHGAMPPERITPIALTLLDALAQAHARGILHRDLNLSNIILDAENNDHIEVIDFGLARVDELVGLTMHTRVLGTLETMAPEAVLGKSIDAQADVFSVGAMLYELVTARPLHDGRMSSGLAFATRDNYLESVRSTLTKPLKDDFPELFQTILRALAPDPTLRFATAAQMADALRGYYDARTWRALENRPALSCEQCERPLLAGSIACVYCGHTPNQLIRDPGKDAYRVAIIRPMNLGAHTPYQLPPKKLRALYEELGRYDDTRSVLQADPGELTPPFTLFDNLAHADAKRVGRLLANRNIRHAITHPSDLPLGLPKPAAKTPKASTKVSTPSDQPSLASHFIVFSGPPLLLLLLSSFVSVAASTQGGWLCLAISAVLSATWAFLFFGLSAVSTRRHQGKLAEPTAHKQSPAISKKSFRPNWTSQGQSFGHIKYYKKPLTLLLLMSGIVFFSWLFLPQLSALAALGIVALTGILAALAGGLLGRGYKRQFQALFSPGETPSKSSVVIPGALLARQLSQPFRDIFPRGTLQTLQKLKPRALQQDFHEILELSARLFQDTRVPARALQDALTPLFTHTNSLLQQLETLLENAPESSAEKIQNALPALDEKLAKSSEVEKIDALISQKATYLGELDALDHRAAQISLARNQLLNVRASVLDLQSQFNRAELPSMEYVIENITDLQIRIDAEREVHELLEHA